MADVLVLGCGLIGTSVGLALTGAGEHDVVLHDEESATISVAVARGAGRAWDGHENVQLVLAAVPPAVTAVVLHRAQGLGLARTYTHVASVQSQVQREIEGLGCDLSTIVGGHPLAGREITGPEGASGDLFAGRPWALCPSAASSAQALGDARSLAEACGAVPLEIDAELHDASVALLSHLPQVTASALAGLLVPDERRAGEEPVHGPRSGPAGALSGPGLADTTRLAAGDATLWTQILTANASHVAPAVRRLAARLLQLAEQLDVLVDSPTGNEADRAGHALRDFLVRGNRGRALVPVKRGVLSEAFAPVAVDVDDLPGRLAALLTAAGEAGVNVEDIRMEHVPGRPRGLIELLVANRSVDELTAALVQDGWDVRGAS